MTNDAPKTVHGYPVIASCYTAKASMTRAGHVVCVKRDENDYVTAWIAVGDREWTWGHYENDYTAAMIDYGHRCVQGDTDMARYLPTIDVWTLDDTARRATSNRPMGFGRARRRRGQQSRPLLWPARQPLSLG